MACAGKIRKVFPGSNSAYGFYSYYDQIIGPEASRIFVIKGGPGVGKSTFMSKIAGEMLARGYDTEYHYCSSDQKSIDAVAVRSIGIAVVDGTAPHLVDPRYPGAVDEIINFGKFWNEAKIISKKVPILKITHEIGRVYKNVYILLHTANLYLKALEGYYNRDDFKDQKAEDCLLLGLTEEILSERSKGNKAGKIRKLFASAITPQGTVNYLGTLTANIARTFVLHGENGKMKDMITKKIADDAVRRGFFVEAFCCALDPYEIDHLIIPELSVAVINSTEPHLFTATGESTLIDTEKITGPLPSELDDEKNDFLNRYREALQRAIGFLGKAKALHDELESYYISNMRFEEIEHLYKQTLERILAYTR